MHIYIYIYREREREREKEKLYLSKYEIDSSLHPISPVQLST